MSGEQDKRLDVDADGNLTVKIGPIRARVVDPAESEEANIVVCCDDIPELALDWPDNIHTRCAGCQRPIVHRPHAPKIPPKVCLDCAGVLMASTPGRPLLVSKIPEGKKV